MWYVRVFDTVAGVAATEVIPAHTPTVPGQTVAAGFVARRERTLALLPAFAELIPGAVVQRGSIVGCEGAAAMSLAIAVAAGPVQQGAWVAVAGASTFGVSAAAELGLTLERLVMVREPSGGFDDGRWADVVAAMIDGFDVVLLGSGARRIRPGIARRLQARVQSRGAVLVLAGRMEAFSCDLQLRAGHQQWTGLGAGHGVAVTRRLQVELHGRRTPRPRLAELMIPAPGGGVEPAPPDTVQTGIERSGTEHGTEHGTERSGTEHGTVRSGGGHGPAAASVALRRTG